ncbi:MAG: RNA methyltransferase [Mangrovibacterium sp.]
MTSSVSPWPKAFTERIRKQFPDAAGAFLDSLLYEARASLRINPLKLRSAHQARHVPWCSTGFFLNERPVYAQDPFWHAGAYYVQEASSMFLEQAFRQIPNSQPLRVLDLCAAPGGKSTLLLDLLKPDDLLVSNELIRSRLPVLSENLVKWGRSNVLISNSDARQFGRAGAFFDLLVVDAPCSGEGLFRRNPDACTEWTQEQADRCSLRQRRILADSWNCLKEGGWLIYSTCTFNPAENEENLRWLQTHASVESIRIPLKAEWRIEELEHHGIYGYRFLPHRVQGEGFFMALLQKTEKAKTVKASSPRKGRFKKPGRIPSHWISRPENMTFFQHRDRLCFIPVAREADVLSLLGSVNILKAGTTTGQRVREQLLPDAGLALSADLRPEAFACTELSLQEALNYLAREPFPLQVSGAPWQLVSYNGLPLGFIKNLGKRFNNYYPGNWRLRIKPEPQKNYWYRQGTDQGT